ncbi:MAG TPA: glycoside hydrolase family 27 protein [Candidatus Aquilonibacter sp.]|jgi:alpha-galactosidase|nr:glycoside hydrolase family 27 protein [Candidatus Aquilonibacter sp.]
MRNRNQTLLVVAAILLICASAPAQENRLSSNLALAPPMGWNSWNKFGCNVSEDMIKSMADAMVKSGMKDAGYQYVNIDDCWQVSRDANGNIVADPQRFPHGMKAVGDYIHSLGLKFGVYSDAGSKTCAGRPGGLGHEYQDALQYAAWGVDYLKYDWCNTTTQDARASYANIRTALDASGRAIVLSICEWGTAKPWLWGKEVGGNLWRTTGDIKDRWQGRIEWKPGDCCSNGVLDIVDAEAELYSYAGRGHWNDPDMLEVGNGGMTDTEYRSHFSLWAILAAPLISGNDLRDMRPGIHDILTNKEVIAVDQDPLGQQGERAWKNGDLEVWAKPLKDASRAVLLLNRGSSEQQISASWEDIGYPGHITASVRDLWQHKDLGKFTGSFSASVLPHGVVMLTVKP